MHAPTPYTLMARNNAWANETLYTVLSAMTEEDFTDPRPGFFPSLSLTMNHILLVDLYYIDALVRGGLGLSLRNRPQVDDPALLAQMQAESDLRLLAFCESLTPAMMHEERLTQRPSGPVHEKVEPLLLHLFQHQIHHRGQAHVQLQEAGYAPPQLDDFYLDYGRVPSAQAWFPH